ncbi:MAG TPA: amidohydrolase family protein [Thermoanaerobaculia bacterium]|nr:amidohydrolase family protein [Thermoanaerobaculia bacterium]
MNAEATLLAGFTTIRSAGSNDRIDVALKRAIERGAAIGPHITPAGYQISMTGGHGDNVGFPEGVFELGPKQGVADGGDQFLFAVRYQIKHGSEVIKLTATAGVLGEERTADARQFSDQELQAIVDEAKRHGLRVLPHAHGTEGIIAAIKAGVASIEHGSMLDAEGIRLMKERGTYPVPTLYIAQPVSGTREGKSAHTVAKGEAMSAAMSVSFRNALAAGVKMARQTRRHHRGARQSTRRHPRAGASGVRDERRHCLQVLRADITAATAASASAAPVKNAAAGDTC